MKLVGLQTIDGGVLLAMPSGEQVLVALPEDRRQAAQVLGRRLLEVLADPGQPHGQQLGSEDEGLLAEVEAGLEAGRSFWQALQLISRTKGRR